MTTRTTPAQASDVHVSHQHHVAIVEIRRPPHNYFDLALIRDLAFAFEAIDLNPELRSSVLCAQGTAFCAGANFGQPGDPTGADSPRRINPIYLEALRLFACAKPMVAAVHGPAIGGGLGLALVADFRVSCPQARFAANFNRLGFHPGFGLSVTLPRLVGPQKAALLFYTGRRFDGSEAQAMGLTDLLVPEPDQVRDAALALATDIAASAPLAVQSTRESLRLGLLDQLRTAVARESVAQNREFLSEDFKEGVAAMAARRLPVFRGR